MGNRKFINNLYHSNIDSIKISILLQHLVFDINSTSYQLYIFDYKFVSNEPDFHATKYIFE